MRTAGWRQLTVALGAIATTVALAATVATTPAASAAAGRASASATTGDGTTGMHPDGRFLRDSRGRVVILHGLFGVWKTATWDPPDSATDPTGFTIQDARHVADLGFNAFRLAYFWEGLEPDGSTVSKKYLDDIARVEHALAIKGVRVVLDSHQDMYSSFFFGDGFPAAAVHNDGLTLASNSGFPLNYFTPAVKRTFTNFWADAGGVTDAYDAQLAVVTKRFAHDPMVLGYDLMNEPFSGENQAICASTAGCPDWDATTLSPAEAGMARAVRSRSSNQLVFYEPQIFANWGTPTGLTPTGDSTGPNAVSFHDQCTARAYYQVTHDRPGALAMEAEVCPSQNATVMANALATSARFGGFPLMTEVAAATDDDYAGLECNLELADQNMLGWTYGLSWRSGELRHLDPTKQDVISRAYPKVIAGDPISYGFDPRTGRFTLSYDTRPDTTGQTMIFLPIVDQYPGGYDVSVQGAKVTSPAGAATLAISNRSGSHRVDITVTPKATGPVVVRPDFPACPS